MSTALRIVLALLVAGSFLAPADAARADGSSPGYVKYYEVASGTPTLATIAERLLADKRRADEIYQLNRGRKQPDGRKLSDPDAVLRAGWLLVVPWDAAGSGIRYGILPGSSGAGQWAIDAIDPGLAHERTSGDGTLVAVLDSGVDASDDALAGRVAEGADIVAGTAGADTDTRGSGTTMAVFISAVAPDARILPVRIVPADATGTATPAAVATGVEVAVSAGADVIAIGSAAPLDDDAVDAAVTAAVSHGVPVVTPATALLGNRPGLLRVASLGPDGPADAAPPAEISAPGIDVSLPDDDRTGSDPAYAVAYAAGTTALVRAAFPDLGAALTARRVEVTGTPLTDGGPALINPFEAVTADLPAESPAEPEPNRKRAVLLGLLVVIVLTAAVLLLRLGSRFTRRHDENDDEPTLALSTGRVA